MKNTLELKLREIGRTLADKQICRFWKIPEEMAVTPCDFFGYTRRGQAILIEAKMLMRPRLPVGKTPGLRVHQINELRDAARAGAIPIVVWERDGFVTAFPVDYIGPTAKSVEWHSSWNHRSTIDNIEAILVALIGLQSTQHQLSWRAQGRLAATRASVGCPEWHR